MASNNRISPQTHTFNMELDYYSMSWYTNKRSWWSICTFYPGEMFGLSVVDGGTKLHGLRP
jgi:hypothetical protein